MKDYKVLGFCDFGKYILFERADKKILIKSALTKIDLMEKLNIPVYDITKDFKDDILEEARLAGKWTYTFSNYKYEKVKD